MTHKTDDKLIAFPPADSNQQHSLGLVIATVQGVNRDGEPLLQWALGGSDTKPVAAQSVHMETPPNWSHYIGKRVVIGFENNNQLLPIIIALLDKPDESTQEKPESLRFDSKKELILECGKAKISLRADGRIIILGGYVVSRSTGVNKIKGGSVQIN